MTADAIRDAQFGAGADGTSHLEVVQLKLLREQDFGSYECTKWTSKVIESDVSGTPNPDFVPKETKEAMKARAEEFLNDFFTPLLYTESVEIETIAIVSHGLFLAALWKSLLAKFPDGSVILGPGVGSRGGTQLLEYLPTWSNTGYLELWISTRPTKEPSGETSTKLLAADVLSKFQGWQVTVKKVNAKDHLEHLKRTRGGIGSVTYDSRQQKLDGFFKKPKVASKTT